MLLLVCVYAVVFSCRCRGKFDVGMTQRAIYFWTAGRDVGLVTRGEV